MIQVHGTCIEVAGIGVLLRGAEGSGKSDLALRLIDGGARLVADDRVDLRPGAGGLWASAPAALAGRLEVRGIGIMAVPTVAAARLGLVCDLVVAEIERIPSRLSAELEGVSLPLLSVAPFEASTPAKVRLAARALVRGIMPDHDDG
jgi:serine kinase of HPr protein (carbohydrate metabolism regulator)